MKHTRYVRAFQKASDPWTFVASTDTPDRYGDVVESSGWDLRAFKKNPIALFQHNSAQPIGTWEDVRVEEGKLVARLAIVKAGVSTIADMVRGMLEERVLRAVSVGFRPLKVEPMRDDEGKPTGGLRFIKQELLEISVVSVPANPQALSVSKSHLFDPVSLLRSDATRPAASSVTKTNAKDAPMKKTLAEKIAEGEAELVRLRDHLTELTGSDSDEDQTDAIEEITRQIEATTKAQATLHNAQAALVASARPAEQDAAETTEVTKGGPAKPRTIHTRGQRDPAALFFRSAVIIMRAHVEKRNPGEIIRADYGGAADLETIVRTATAPAMTSVAGWAAELVGETTDAFVDLLRPGSIFFSLGMMQFTFGRGKLRIPSRASGDLAGSFVGEGAPIPVKQLALASVLMQPYKLGVISTFTRELDMLSDPAVEPLFRNIMTEDTRETIDVLFMDDTAAVPNVRPAGLQSLAGLNTVASSGTTLANIITDMKAAMQAMADNRMGTRLVWIIPMAQLVSLSLQTNAAGNFMFRDEMANGTIMGIPFLSNVLVPAETVFLVDAAELMAAYSTTPMIDASEQATLHMDNAPAPISTVGTPNAVAAPVRSLWQTASWALRLLWDLTWNQRRPNAVFTITGVQW